MPRKPDGDITQAALGRALGIGQSLVSRYLGQGMPDDIEGARAWMKRNVNLRLRMTDTPNEKDMAYAACVLAKLCTREAERKYRSKLGKYGTDEFGRALDTLLTILPPDRKAAVYIPTEVERLLDSDTLWEQPSRFEKACDE